MFELFPDSRLPLNSLRQKMCAASQGHPSKSVCQWYPNFKIDLSFGKSPYKTRLFTHNILSILYTNSLAYRIALTLEYYKRADCCRMTHLHPIDMAHAFKKKQRHIQNNRSM